MNDQLSRRLRRYYTTSVLIAFLAGVLTHPILEAISRAL